MPKLLCTLPNASTEIRGIKFAAHAKGMLSEDVSDDVAKVFATIPGYTVIGGPDAAAKAAKEAEDKALADAEAAANAQTEADAAAKADLVKRAEAISFKVKASWGLERLKSEVEAAESVAQAEEAAK